MWGLRVTNEGLGGGDEGAASAETDAGKCPQAVWTRTTRRARISLKMEIRHRHKFERIGTEVLPPEHFSDKYVFPDPEFGNEGRGPESDAIRGLIACSCGGWEKPPTSWEFYEAMRVTTPTERQNVVAGTLVGEASNDTLALAYLQGAFTWRQVAAVLRRRGAYSSRQARYVNLHAAHAGTGGPHEAPGAGGEPLEEAPQSSPPDQ